MAYNQEVLVKLQDMRDLEKLHVAKKEDVLNALQAVFNADLTNANGFRQAFRDHQSIWKEILGLDKDFKDFTGDAFLILEGEGDDDIKKKANSFTALQNAAAFAYASLKLGDLPLKDLKELAGSESAVKNLVVNKPANDEDDYVIPKDFLNKDNVKALQFHAKQLLFAIYKEELNALEVDDTIYENLIKYYNTKELDEFNKNSIIKDFPQDWITSNQQLVDIHDLLKQKALNYDIEKLSKSEDKKEILDVLKATKPVDIDDKGWLSQDNIESLKDAARKAFIPMIQKDIAELKKGSFEALCKAASSLSLKVFKEKLKEAGIKESDLLESEDMEELLPSMREKAFELFLEKNSHFRAAGHPDLIKAFKNVEHSKQFKIIKNIAENKADIRSILEDADLSTREVKDENEKLALLNQLHNAEVARILADPETPVLKTGINQDFIDSLNKIFDGGITEDNDYSRFVEIAIKIANRDSAKEKIYEAFGLKKDGSIQNEDPKLKSIRSQNGYNIYLKSKLRTHPHVESNLLLYHFFSSIFKTQPISAKDAENILSAFKENNTYSEFIEKLKEHKIDKKFAPDWQQHFTPANFNQVKIKEIAQIEEPEEQKKVANNIFKAMKKKFHALEMTDAHARSSLKKIKNTEFETWLNPAFMAKARRDAGQLRAPFERLARNCPVIIRHLEEQQEYLEGLKEHFKGDGTFPTNINKALKTIENELKRYKEVQGRLMGQDDPKEKGILQLIDEAARGDVAIRGYYSDNELHVRVDTIDDDGNRDEKLKGLIKKKDYPSSENLKVTNDNSDSVKFEGDKVGDGKIRVFNVEYKKNQGQFIEEIGPSNPASVTVKDKPSTPLVKLEATEFPKSEVAKIHFAMVMASQMLSSLDGPPSKKQPIVLRGGNEEQLQYLWTALMVLGRDTKHMKFGADAIKVASFSFDPTKEKGMLGFLFGNNSLHDTIFKDNAKAYEPHVNQFRSLCEQKFGHGPNVKRASAEITRLHRGKIQEILGETNPEAPEQQPRGPK